MSQNKLANKNSNGNSSQGIANAHKIIPSNSKITENNLEINDLKGFNDYVIEGFIDNSMRIGDKK